MRTVMLGQTLVTAVCALVVVLLWRHARRRYAGLGYLAADFALQLAGVVLITLRGLVPETLSIVAGTPMGMAGQVFLCRGLALFSGKSWNGRLEISALSLHTAAHFYYSVAQPSLPARNLLIAVFLSFFCARAAWLLLAKAAPALKSMSWLLVYSLGGFTVVNLLRIWLIVFGKPPHDFFHSHSYDALLILFYSALLVSLTFGIYLLVNRRLLADTMADFDGRVRAEEALLENAYRLELALDSAAMGAWEWDIKSNRRHFDARTCALLGLDPASFKGTPEEFFAAIHPGDREAVRAALLRTLGTDAPYSPEYRVVRPDGSLRHISSRGKLRRDADGNPQRVDGILWDVTERKRAEEDLKASEERFTKAFRAAPMLMSLSEIETGRYIEVNDKFCEVTGYAREELIGKTSVEVGWITAEARAELLRCAAGGGSLRVPELELMAKGGRPVICSYACERIGSGEKAILLAIAEDITAFKGAEAAQLAAQKLESLGTLAGGIAHDFNNLLTGITGNLSMLRNAAGAETAELVREAETACHTAKGLARQLLTFASGGEPVKAPLDLAALAAESVSFSLRGSSVKGRVESDGRPAHVLGDREQLFQVINNLVMNAAQAMPSGGAITVRTASAELARGEVPQLPQGEYCALTVADSGHGIPPGMLARVFDPYFSTKGKGRGLGLSVCRSIVLKHGGQITVRSGQNGSAFTVYLPVTDARPAQAPAVRGCARSGGGRVLVMDDEEIVYKALRRMLTELGYEAEVTENGEAALEAWKKAKSEGRPFSAAIMDLTISGGMGGAEAVKALRGMDPGAKVIVSSGYSDGPVMADYAAHGFAASLSKPYQIDDLAAVMNKVLC